VLYTFYARSNCIFNVYPAMKFWLGPHIDPEKRRFVHSIILPLFFAASMLLVMAARTHFGFEWHMLGIYPRSLSGAKGILLSPLLHSGWEHFYNNILSFTVLSVCLFYFYRGVSYRVFAAVYLASGLLLWIGGRPAYHIGASGLIYALASFLFFSGLMRRHIPLLSISLFVAFLYGGMVWGMVPLPDQERISWEGHLLGFAAGLGAALVFLREGPQKPPPQPEEAEEAGSGADEFEYWMLGGNEDTSKNAD
jgi:membrane associated rhomboid family serine protease